jgi:hypothetical protein
MGRFTGLMLFLIALQAILVIFEGATPETTAIWDVVTKPFEWGILGLIVTIAATAATLYGATILIGSVLGIKTDFMVLAILVPSLIGFGAVLSQFAGVIGKYSCNIFCEADIDVAALTWSSCPAAVWLVAITAGALTLYYIIAVLDWWRSPNT